MTEIHPSKVKDLAGENSMLEKGELGPSERIPYPKAVFFIIATELSERFSYYGMRAVLTLYLTNMLNFSDNQATTIYHMFLLLCYGLPLFWGIMADSYLGKFRTICILSVCFAIGNIVLTLSSVPPLNLPQRTMTMIGLALMATGTGGMKPCVAPFGGEQFVIPQQSLQLQQFFSVFFFAVTVGNMVSTVITPLFRQDVHCFDMDSCYPLAFGVPACTMLFAIVIFASGKSLYKIKEPQGNVIVDVAGCITYAMLKKKDEDLKKETKSHWLDRASDKYDEKLIRDVKGLLRVLLYYLPIPMFFALYEQLGSRWTLQATRMTGLIGNFTIKPDQMQVCNALMMFIFIPVFHYGVYPLFGKCNLLKRPLQRMCVGGFLAALSFLVAGIVELQIHNSVYIPPRVTETDVHFINTFPCPVTIQAGGTNHAVIDADASTMLSFDNVNIINMTLSLNETCSLEVPIRSRQWDGQITLFQGHMQSVLITLNEQALIIPASFQSYEEFEKSKEGTPKIRVSHTGFIGRIVAELTVNGKSDRNLQLNSASVNETSPWVVDVKADKYSVTLRVSTENGPEVIFDDLEEIDLLIGGSYLLLIHPSYDKLNTFKTELIVLSPPNEISMLWQLPQYILMAWAEILFVVSGMEFSFTEAPVSMKSVLQSLWHLMNAFGNVVVILSALGGDSDNQSTEFFGFSGAMFVDTIIFCLLAMRYKYVTLDAEETQHDESTVDSFKDEQLK